MKKKNLSWKMYLSLNDCFKLFEKISSFIPKKKKKKNNLQINHYENDGSKRINKRLKKKKKVLTNL